MGVWWSLIGEESWIFVFLFDINILGAEISFVQKYDKMTCPCKLDTKRADLTSSLLKYP